MARLPRITIPGVLHHIVHRGNNRNDVFFEQDDYKQYLSLLSHYSRMYNFSILSYCLMTNHVHIVGIPADNGSMSNMIWATHYRYSLQLNQKMGNCGHNWQSRFFSCPCDEFHGISSIRYVELNPVRAGLVDNPWNYLWSSAMYHVGIKRYPDLLDFKWWNMRFSLQEWKEILMQQIEMDLIPDIRENTRSGTPLGNSEFRELVLNQAGVELERRSRGRPRKNGA